MIHIHKSRYKPYSKYHIQRQNIIANLRLPLLLLMASPSKAPQGVSKDVPSFGHVAPLVSQNNISKTLYIFIGWPNQKRMICQGNDAFLLTSFLGPLQLKPTGTPSKYSDDQISNEEEESIRNKRLPLILKERHLCMSITPKSHVMAAHSIQQLVRICGFTDLAEDAGERNHQDELKAENVVEPSVTTRERRSL
jgi:hypothetical protein